MLLILPALLLAAAAAAAPTEPEPAAPEPSCNLGKLATEFPALKFPAVIDEKKWKAETASSGPPVSRELVAGCLQQDPGAGSFFPFGRFPVRGHDGELSGIVVRLKSPGSGENDAYYLMVLGPEGRLRSVLLLATFAGGPSYLTRSRATLRSSEELEIREIYAELAPGNPEQVIRRDSTSACYAIAPSGLPSTH